MAGKDNLKPWEPGQSGNPAGKPKGTKHVSTWIQEMLNDEEFEIKIKGGGTIKGAPMKAVITAAIAKAASGDYRALDILFKHGWGSKQVHEFDGNPIDRILEKYGLNSPNQNKDGEKKDDAGETTSS